MQQQDETVGKLNKDKKHHEELARKLTEDLHSEEDKVEYCTNKNDKHFRITNK
jgi:hypothetical protein